MTAGGAVVGGHASPGYFPAQHLGLGEDIPQSRAAMGRAALARPAPEGQRRASRALQAMLDRSAALQRPALVVSISDDAFATEGG